MTADVTGKKVIAGPVEGTIAGNIGTQGICQSTLKDIYALREMITHSFTLEKYYPENQGYWDKNEQTYQDLCQF